jgi:transcriptional regulator with XRE-family HTH domain
MAEQTLGSRIRELRQARGYSMRELTSRSKLKSVAFIADLERGFRNPSPEVLANLAVGLGVPLDDLRSHDRRAPLHEIAKLAEKDAAWASAFRAVVDAANSGKLTPKKLQKLLEASTVPPDAAQQPVLNL